MVGCYNTVLSTSMDLTGNHTTNCHPLALEEIANIMNMLEFTDILRHKNSDLVRYTWRLNQASQIDYFPVSFSMLFAMYCISRMESDHQPIDLHVNMTRGWNAIRPSAYRPTCKYDRNSSRWQGKFKPGFIDWHYFLIKNRGIRSFLLYRFSGPTGSYGIPFKCSFRGRSIPFSVPHKLKQYRLTEKRLTAEIENLTLHINGVDKCKSTEELSNLDTKQKEFKEFIQERSGFTYQTNWANYMEDGDWSLSSYWSRRIKFNVVT